MTSDVTVYAEEQQWIARARQHGHDLTNATDGGEGWINPTLDVRLRLSVALKGKLKTPEHRANATAARRKVGWAMSAATKQKLSEALTGRTQSAETIEKRMKQLRGRKMPVDGVARRAEMMRGVPLSQEHRDKLSLAHQDSPERNKRLLLRVQKQIAQLEAKS